MEREGKERTGMVGAVPSKERNAGLFDPVYGMALCPVEGKDAGIVASTFQPKLRLATAIVMSEAVGPSDVRGGISLKIVLVRRRVST